MLVAETLGYLLRNMHFVEHTHIVVRVRDQSGLHPIGGGTVSSVVSRFGRTYVDRCVISNDLLYIDTLDAQ